jgi:DNA-binding XRE family transcriptional regulator
MIQFQSKKANKVITLNRDYIPKKLKEVLFIVKEGIVLYDFFDMDKVSISNEMMEIKFEDTTIYHFITERLTDIIKKESIVENTEYIFNVGWKYRNVSNYLDRTKFMDVRHKAKLSILDLSFRIDISRESIYLIEGGEVKNVRSDMLIKYALFFKKPISYFLKQDFKSKVAEVDAKFIAESGITSEEQNDLILAYLNK